MRNDTFKGILCGVLSAVSFGTNPLFALPLYQRGMNTCNVLLYRFFFAVLLLGGLILIRRESFRIGRKHWVPAVFAGLLLAFTCLFMFLSLWFLDAGIAATILFVYPLMVALIMRVFFQEKLNAATWIGMFLSLGGIAMLYRNDGVGKFSVTGVVYILLSALTYAVYMVHVKESQLKTLPPGVLTFYAMALGLPVFLISLRGGADLQLPPDLFSWGCVFGLALCPALLSFVLLAAAVRCIGATKTAILGASEPITSILIGVLIFGEKLNLRQILGIVLILGAVTLAVAVKRKSSGPSEDRPEPSVD